MKKKQVICAIIGVFMLFATSCGSDRIDTEEKLVSELYEKNHNIKKDSNEEKNKKIEDSKEIKGTEKEEISTEFEAVEEFVMGNENSFAGLIENNVSESHEGEVNTKNEVEMAIASLEGEGYRVGYYMLNLVTGEEAGYESDANFLLQSAIKAPYMTALLIEKPEVYTEYYNEISNALIYSDNDSYEGLRAEYGNVPMLDYCRNLGLRDSIADREYIICTPRELAILWEGIYQYLEKEECPSTYANLLTNTKYSILSQELSSQFTLYSKAGWEDGLYGNDVVAPPNYTDGILENDEVATVDAGVVYTQKGPVVIAIMSNICANPDKLAPVVRGISNLYLN